MQNFGNKRIRLARRATAAIHDTRDRYRRRAAANVLTRLARRSAKNAIATARRTANFEFADSLDYLCQGVHHG